MAGRQGYRSDLETDEGRAVWAVKAQAAGRRARQSPRAYRLTDADRRRGAEARETYPERDGRGRWKRGC